MKSQRIFGGGVLVGKVMIPALLLISLPMITFSLPIKMSKEAVIFFFGDQKLPLLKR